MMMKQQPILHTARLTVRPFRAADAAAVQRLAGDRAIADTTLHIPHPYADGVAEQWIASHAAKFAEGELANFAIALRQSGKLVGCVGLTILPDFDCAELGYWIGKDSWGLGYATEACRAVLDYAFVNLNLNRVYAMHMHRNPASGRVMEKLGMLREGQLRHHIKKWEKYEDVVVYGLLRDEWVPREKQPGT
jgi:RimJ/RimL family protein N-acetyltransferase